MRTGLFLALWLCGCSLWAFQTETEPLVTDRPDQTESTMIVPTRTAQLETGIGYESIDVQGEDLELTAVPQTLVRIGISKLWELRVGHGGWVDQDFGPFGSDDGFADSHLGAKFKLGSESASRPDMALLVGVDLPTGDDEFTADEEVPSFRFAFAKTLSEKASVGLNVGGYFPKELSETGREARFSVAQYTLAFGFGLSERVGWFIEAFGDIPISAEGGPQNGVDSGFTYLITPRFQLDLAGGTSLNDDGSDLFATFGFSYRFGR